MSGRTLSPNAEEWVEYFSSLLGGTRYVASVALLIEPHRPATNARRPLRAIGYDPDKDVLEVVVGNDTPHACLVRYFISAPCKVGVEEAGEVTAILVDDASGARTLIRLFPVSCE